MTIKFGLCNELFTDRSVFKTIEYAAHLGYHGIEIAPYTLTDDLLSFPVDEQKKIAQCAADYGIEVIGLHWLLTKPEGLHLTTADKTVRQKTLDFFKKLIEINTNAGGRIMTLGSPYQRNFADSETQPIAAERTIKFFTELISELESTGSVVALEPLETEYTNFMTRTEETCKIIDEVDSKSVGITLDTHFLRWESSKFDMSIADIFERVGHRLVHLHIQDDNMGPPGTGTADFSEFITVVKQIGWNSYVSMETFDQHAPGEQIAKEGVNFMKERFML